MTHDHQLNYAPYLGLVEHSLVHWYNQCVSQSHCGDNYEDTLFS